LKKNPQNFTAISGKNNPSGDYTVISELIKKNRSYRRFDATQSIPTETLREWVNLARLSPSAANKQPLKFILSNTPQKNTAIFKNLKWAAYLTDWGGPQPEEQPTAYIIILGDNRIRKNVTWDDGIAAQSILLGAVEKGYGGCILASIHKEGLRKDLQIPETFEILLVLALGKPIEQVVIDDLTEESGVKYWRDAQEIHHVPKRVLNDLILE
jgi:nitroreductase